MEGDSVRCTLAGKTDTPLRLSVFRDEGDYVEREYRAVDAFEGEGEVG